MKFALTETAARAYDELPTPLRAKAAKQFENLTRDLRYPSLHAKKYDERRGIWQARIDGAWRFYFVIDDDTYYIIAITPHRK